MISLTSHRRLTSHTQTESLTATSKARVQCTRTTISETLTDQLHRTINDKTLHFCIQLHYHYDLDGIGILTLYIYLYIEAKDNVDLSIFDAPNQNQMANRTCCWYPTYQFCEDPTPQDVLKPQDVTPAGVIRDPRSYSIS